MKHSEYIKRILQEVDERLEFHARMGSLIMQSDLKLLNCCADVLRLYTGIITMQEAECGMLKDRLVKIEESGYTAKMDVDFKQGKEND